MTPEEIAEQLVTEWQQQDRMPPMAWDFRGFAAAAAKMAAQSEREACAKDAARYRWLANNCDGDAQDDIMRWLAGTVAPKEIIDTQIDEAMERSNA